MAELKGGETIRFFKALGLFLLYAALTFIFVGIAGYVFGDVLAFEENAVYGSLFVIIILFWSGYLLSKKGYKNKIGIVFFSIGIILDQIMISSPYDTREEYAAARVFIIYGIVAGVYLILRKSRLSRIFGIITIIISVFSMLLGAVFLWMKTP